jgi:hypothetical protein
MKRLHAYLAAVCCAMPLSFAQAQNLGNYVDVANFSVSGMAWALGGPVVQQKLAQTLTVVQGGTLEGVFLPLLCGTGPDVGTAPIHVEIHDVVAGMPGPNVLAKRAVAPTEVDLPVLRFMYIKIPGALPLLSGEQVAIVVTRPKGGECALAESTVDADYKGGQGFFDARPNPPGWVPFANVQGAPDDLPFQLVLSQP